MSQRMQPRAYVDLRSWFPVHYDGPRLTVETLVPRRGPVEPDARLGKGRFFKLQCASGRLLPSGERPLGQLYVACFTLRLGPAAGFDPVGIGLSGVLFGCAC